MTAHLFVLRHPVASLVPLAFVSSWLGLGLYAHPLALILLLTQLIVFLEIASTHAAALRIFTAEWLFISIGNALSYHPAARTALVDGESAGVAFCFTLLLTAMITLWSLFALSLASWTAARCQSGALRCLLIPLVWTLAWAAYSVYSPLGRQGSWTPRGGFMSHYEWLLPTFGQPVLDFVTAATASSTALFILPHFHLRHESNDRTRMPGGYGAVSSSSSTHSGDNDGERSPLISLTFAKRQVFDRTHNTTAWFTLAVLTTLALPGHLSAPAPDPNPTLHPTEEVTIGCALPPPGSDNLDGFLHESRVLAGRGVKIIVWPEAAINIKTTQERQTLLDSIAEISQQSRTLIGATYEAPQSSMKPEPGYIPSDLGKVNAMTLMGHDGKIVFTYAKQALVPLVESFAFHPGTEPLPMANATIPIPTRGHRTPKLPTTSLMLSVAICHDLSFPSLLTPASGSALILSPASLWSSSMAWARLHGDVIWRARESSIGILTCDGGRNGISSFVDARGRIRYWQPSGAGSFALPIHFLQVPSGFYTRFGDFGSTILLMLIVGIAWGIEGVWLGFDEEWISFSEGIKNVEGNLRPRLQAVSEWWSERGPGRLMNTNRLRIGEVDHERVERYLDDPDC